MAGKLLVLTYGGVAYLAFLATFVYAIGFVGNLGVPWSIDASPVASFEPSLAVDVALLGLFALQHSVMARPAFKRMFARVAPPAIERSTFVLASSAALALLFWQWRPLGGVVWDVEAPWARAALLAASASGWGIVFVSSWLLDHFALFGLRQVWAHWRGATPTPAPFSTPGLYRFVRHPIYLGFTLAFWATPTMSVTHLVFASATTLYMLLAIQLEERDLLAEHPEYAEYRRRVPMLVPGWNGAAAKEPIGAS
jgi:protein-S-isoprenylcysteine O-methyltransferase Ste14